MAGNFIPVRPFTYVAGAPILSAQNNANENELYSKASGAFNALTGHQHTGAPGDGPLLPASSITPTFLTNVDVYNGFDFRTYSDAGVTQTSAIDGATGNMSWKSGTLFYGTFDHAITAPRTWTFPDASGTVVLTGGGAPSVFTDNIDVYNGFDFRAYSDAGVTLKASIDGATGNAIFGGATIGGDKFVTAINTDDTNPASRAFFTAETGGAGSGDPIFLWRITGVQAYYAGIDNSDVDKWKFGQGIDVGVNTKLTFDVANDRWGFFTTTPGNDVEIARTKVGSDISFAVTNVDNTNGASRAVSCVVTGGASGGDPLFCWAISGVTTWVAGLDNSDSDNWKLCNNSAVGTNTAITVTSALNTIFSGSCFTTGTQSSLSAATIGAWSIYNALTAHAHVTVANDADNGTIIQQFNVASSTRNLGVPKTYTLTFTTALNNTNATPFAVAQSGTNDRMFASYYAMGSTDMRVRMKEESGATEYCNFGAGAFGGLS